MILDSLGSPVPSQGPYEREGGGSEAERRETLSCWPRVRDAAPLEAGKGGAGAPWEPPEGPALPTPGFSPVVPMWDS